MSTRRIAGGAIDRRSLARLAGAFVLAAAVPALGEDDESVRLNAFFETVFQRDLARSPIRQSRLGLGHDNDKWDDISDARRVADAALVRGDLEALRGFDVSRLNPQAKLSYRMFELACEDQLRLFNLRWDDYLVTQMGGMHTRVPITLQNSHPIKTRADAAAYVARLHGVKPLMDQLVVELKTQEAKGVVPPKFIFPLTIDASRNVVTGRPFDDGPKDSPLYADFKAKVEKAGFAQADRDELVAKALAGLNEGVGPGYRALIAHLEAVQATARDDAGVWKLPDGGAYYRAMLQHYTTLPMTADDLHALGLKEIERMHGEMRAIMQKTGFTGSLQDFFKYVRTDPKFYYPDTDAGRAQYVADAKALLAEVRSRAHEVLDIQPKADVVVRPVEAWREKSAAKAFYSSPPEDDSSPGIFYVNLYDMGAAPKYELAVTLYHEAVPGHHVETVVGQEIPGLPRFRKFASIAAYSEGWGLYAERLTKEMGLYQDPYSDFGRLALSVMRAARLVVDTGMHAKKWTREQATQFMDDNMPSTHYDNQREIDRYVVIPGQAVAYEVGMLKIVDLREKAKAALGSRFDIRAFHDVVVGNGPVPLPILEENVDAWIKTGGGFPPGRPA